MLNQSTNMHLVIEIVCREQPSSVDCLRPTEAMKVVADAKERILDMQLIMNVICNTDGTLIKGHNRKTLGGIKRYSRAL